MVDIDPDALRARWRRLDKQLAMIEANISSPGPEVPDAVAQALNAIYELWEVKWRGTRLKHQDQQVAGDVGGETAAALVFARGGQTHQYVDFGVSLGFGRNAYGIGPYGANGWHWQRYVDRDPRYVYRNGWYTQHVCDRAAGAPLDVAYRWMRSLPSLQ